MVFWSIVVEVNLKGRNEKRLRREWLGRLHWHGGGEKEQISNQTQDLCMHAFFQSPGDNCYYCGVFLQLWRPQTQSTLELPRGSAQLGSVPRPAPTRASDSKPWPENLYCSQVVWCLGGGQDRPSPRCVLDLRRCRPKCHLSHLRLSQP